MSPSVTALARLPRPVRVLLVALALTLLAPAAAQAWTIERTSSPKLYIDTAQTNGLLYGAYASYVVTNDADTPIRDAWVAADGFTGSAVALAPHENGLVHVGAMPAGARRTVSVLLRSTTPTTVVQHHAVRVFSGKPGVGGTELASQPFGLTVETNNFNNANKVSLIETSTTTPALGGTVVVTVHGTTGTIGAGKVLSFSPAGYDVFPASSMRLVRSEIRMQDPDCPAAGANCGTFVDRLSIPADEMPATVNTPYTAVYTFRAADVTTSATSLSPVGYISAGQAPAHTSTANFSALAAIQPVKNELTLALSADRTAAGPSAPSRTVTYTAEVRNGGTGPVTFDDYVATLPAGADYVEGSARYAGETVDDPRIEGDVASFVAPFAVPGSGAEELTFEVVLPATEGPKVTSVVAHSGDTQIDTTLTTTDAPAEAGVTVDVTPPVAEIVTKPDASTSATTGTFTLRTGDDPDASPATFSCRLDGGAWAACTSPASYPGLQPGAHTFDVRAQDAAGNVGPEATHTWTVVAGPPDTAAPTIDLRAPVDGAVLRLGATVLADYACADPDGRSAVVRCAGPVPTGSAIDTATAGEHRFTVGTEDAAGNDAERTVTYTVQAPPSPGDRDSTGVGTEPQRTTVPVPAGATVRLVAADGTAATTVDVTGGRYVLDAATGEITFTPVLGLVGPAPAVRFRVTDDLGQRGDARYTPSVVAPAPAPAPDEETAGASAEVQERTLTVPHGGTITLLDTHDVPTTVVSVAGEGTYALDAATGRVSFVPAAGFHGRATTVRYRVTDAYGQATTGRFTATVRPAPADVPAAPADPSDEPAVPVAPVAPVVPSAPAVPVTGAAPATGTAPAQTAAPASAPVRVTVAIPGRSVATTAVRASCRADGATVRDCAVVLNARVAGRAVVVGHARERGAGRASVEVAVPLTALGRALAARPGGQAIGVVATVRGTDGSTHVARSRTRVVAKTFAVPRPVLFATASAELSRGERHYVDGLAARLRGVKRLRCVGFTDSRDTVPYNRRLGLERAAVVCDRLGRLLGVHATSATRVSRGERGPRASNATARGRRLNRRTEIRVSY